MTRLATERPQSMLWTKSSLRRLIWGRRRGETGCEEPQYRAPRRPHHDIAQVDAGGTHLAEARISDDAAGVAQLTALLLEHGDRADPPIPVAMETSRGLVVACVRAAGRPVYAINPLAVAHYRDRHSVVARKKSDAVDALVLAKTLRTDMAVHRPLPADPELVQAIAVLARAQQDAVWDRGQVHTKLRSQLREFDPAILEAFAEHQHGRCSREARAVLAAPPTPTAAGSLTRRRLQSLLRQPGRVRNNLAEADRLHEVFPRDHLHQLPQVEGARGRQTSALLRQLNTACLNVDQLEEATTQAFQEHPDAPVIRSFPGLGSSTGARVLAEIGDDRTRFANASSLKAYAASAPVTRAGGKNCSWTWRVAGLSAAVVVGSGARRLGEGHEASHVADGRQAPVLDPSAHLSDPCTGRSICRRGVTLIRVGCLPGDQDKHHRPAAPVGGQVDLALRARRTCRSGVLGCPSSRPPVTGKGWRDRCS